MNRFFSIKTGVLAFRFARHHRHDHLGIIAIRCMRCNPPEFDSSPQGLPAFSLPVPMRQRDKADALADLQARPDPE